MDRDTDSGQMEVVKEDGNMVMHTLGCCEVQLECPLANAY